MEKQPIKLEGTLIKKDFLDRMSYIHFEFAWQLKRAARRMLLRPLLRLARRVWAICRLWVGMCTDWVLGGIEMVTVKRKKKRSLNSPAGRWAAAALAVLAIALIALCAWGLAGRFRYANRLDDLTDYMAKSVRTDLNQAVQACDSLDRRSSDMAGETLTNMKRYMYAAYRTNLILVAACGERYSIIDTATYNNFQTLVGEYERLLANGQSTATVKTTLNDYMDAISQTLYSRFDSADVLLPLTATRNVK